MKVITPITITDTIVTGGASWSRGSDATYYDYNGVLKTATTNVPRTTYTPSTKAYQGLLVEGAATNLLTRSNAFNDGNWTKNNSTAAASAASAPTNAVEAQKITENATNTVHSVAQAATVVSGSTYCLSVYAKKAERDWICLELSKSGSSPEAWFNLATGNTGTTTTGIVSRAMEAITDGWYRCSIRVAMDSTTTTAAIYTATADNVISFAGSASNGVFLYGAQLELNNQSSYITTTTTTVTRAADTPGVYNSIPENDYTAWSGTGVVYTATARVIYEHKIYSAATQHTSAATAAPATTAGALLWNEVGPTNRWAMFDNTSQTVTSANNDIFVIIRPGAITSMACMGLLGQILEVCAYSPGSASPMIYKSSNNLDGSEVSDWYEYFYSDTLQKDVIALSDVIYPIGDTLLAVRMLSTGTANIGTLVAGKSQFIGSTQLGASIGIIDYSRIETNEFGVTSFVQRTYSKRNSVKLFIENNRLNRIYRILADLRATPAIWIGTEDSTFEPLVVFGFYKDFSIDVAYNYASYCSLEIEGLA